MDQKDWQNLHDKVIEWIFQAGDQLRQSLSVQLEVSVKTAHNDLVTNMDKAIEKFLVGKIKETYPDHRVVSEEGFGDAPTDLSGVVWFVDPIDGTLNYVLQKRFFAISIGIYENGKGKAAFVYDVMGSELFHCISGFGAYRNEHRLPSLKMVKLEDALVDLSMTWIKPNRRIDQDIMTDIIRKCSGTRAYGAASIELAYVASGLIDAYFTMRLSPWDYAAGLILIREVGGTATKANGSSIDLLSRTSVLTAGPSLHNEIAEHIRKQVDEGKFLKEPN
ncbi:inositol monophosphatase family protein [Sporolactobacillus shoreae]|uniref:inositol-phosphate phosphatase n=1 Tax=Sporolactobacillus shoreae TaxID=1465501 RepID=A0A4Z0GRZ2_9BACL|nr:inositol monophosphatase family protein [Sporolactobacillus shoreae]TGB00174.1 inositol monophosphatase family protein [Sporolactobacillus shoreae]